MTVSTIQPGNTLIRRPAPQAVPRTLTSTVPRELVHRAAVAEVMLTGWQRLDDTSFRMTAQWPRGHSFFTPTEGGHHDPLIAAETIRQVGSLLAHAEFGVPFGHQFLMEDLALTVHPEQLLIGPAPADLELEVTCTAVRRGRRLGALRYTTTVLRGGRRAASGRFSFTSITPAVYRRLRPERVFDPGHRPLALTAPVAPQSVGRLSPSDVVLSPTAGPNVWQLRVDTRHPVLFDHQLDHVPGMLLLEAARQGATAALGARSILPLTMACDFRKYVELDLPCVIEAVPESAGGPGTPAVVRIIGRQQDEPVFTCVVTALPGN
jgi:hypothetical protein